VEDVLIESGEEENLVALERAADGASKLLLALCGVNARKALAAPRELSRMW
jgi:hypothetical protein